MSDRKVSSQISPMEDQVRPEKAQQTLPPTGFAGSRRVTEHLAADGTKEGPDEFTSGRQRTVREKQDTVNEFATVVFENHVGDRYVWPFERCRSFDVSCLSAEIGCADHEQDGQDSNRRGLCSFR